MLSFFERKGGVNFVSRKKSILPIFPFLLLLFLFLLRTKMVQHSDTPKRICRRCALVLNQLKLVWRRTHTTNPNSWTTFFSVLTERSHWQHQKTWLPRNWQGRPLAATTHWDRHLWSQLTIGGTNCTLTWPESWTMWSTFLILASTWVSTIPPSQLSRR